MSAAAVAPAQQAQSSQSVVLTKPEADVSSDKKPASATTRTLNGISTSAETKEKAVTASSAETDDPLPADLKMILTEVACTGKCPWLSWNGKHPPEAPMPPDMQVAVSNNSATKSSSRVFAKHRPTSSAFSSFSSRGGAPARKKLRNGVHSSRRRYSENGSSGTAATAASSSGGNATAATITGRKRPLYLTRTPSTTGSAYSVSSIGSGRTSGSEVEDSTQYECDSEGTSATTNSEVSVERRAARKRVIVQTSPGLTPSLAAANTETPTCRFKTLRGALRSALGLVLDNSYRNRGGYKLSPAELRIHAAAVASQSAASNAIALSEGGNGGSEKENSPELELEPPSPEKTFQQRRRRLLALVGEDSADSSSELQSQLAHHQSTAGPSYLGDGAEFESGPPFTIQRIAEVLLAPERYYKQTHKLCNCLEKLLLVTSPASSFGESTGADMWHSKAGENDLSVTSEKKGGRQDLELRTKRLKRRMSSSSDDDGAQKSASQHDKTTDGVSANKSPGSDGSKEEMSEALKEGKDKHTNGKELSSKEILEAAARAQLRSKFDHVGIDPHSSSAVDRSVPGIPNRGMTSSPPPPGLANSSAALSPHGAVSGFARHVGEQSGDSSCDSTPHPSTVQQNPMPFFSAANETATPIPAVHANQGMQMLQMHHSAAVLSGGGAHVNNPPLELVVGPDAGGTSSGATAASALSSANVANLDQAEPSNRSSGTNSDVDSESDDFSLDDSASDRSDGSDSGVHCEPFTAARVAALNRIQQQRSMQNRAAQTTLHYQHGLGFRPPLDTEYQSGDSIDSTMAEDSCGSDSSSASDLMD